MSYFITQKATDHINAKHDVICSVFNAGKMSVCFALYFSWRWKRHFLASCDSFDRNLQVNYCFGWTSCWFLVLLVLSLKDNFIVRNLSHKQCAGLLYLFSAESTFAYIKGTLLVFQITKKEETISALNCATPWHQQMPGWKSYHVTGPCWIYCRLSNKVWKDPVICWADCVSLGNCLFYLAIKP